MATPARDETGSATTQLVVATPVLLLLIVLVVQFALYQHASHVVTVAAQHAATAAQGEDGSVAAGRTAADSFLAGRDDGVLRSRQVSVTRTGSRTRVVVRGQVIALVPGFSFTVTGVSDGPTERFVTPTRTAR